jgi:hypothetical protein
MPELCRFYGIVIKMHRNEHPPPHFHAAYGSEEALIDFERMSVYAGKLSPRALGLVMEWTALHQSELRERWEAAQNHRVVAKIAPLD